MKGAVSARWWMKTSLILLGTIWTRLKIRLTGTRSPKTSLNMMQRRIS